MKPSYHSRDRFRFGGQSAAPNDQALEWIGSLSRLSPDREADVAAFMMGQPGDDELAAGIGALKVLGEAQRDVVIACVGIFLSRARDAELLWSTVHDALSLIPSDAPEGLAMTMLMELLPELSAVTPWARTAATVEDIRRVLTFQCPRFRYRVLAGFQDSVWCDGGAQVEFGLPVERPALAQ